MAPLSPASRTTEGAAPTGAAPADRCACRRCPTRTRSTTRCSRPPSPPATSSTRLQQRGPGRRRQDAGQHLPRPAHERGALLSRPAMTAPQPARRHRGADATRPARRQTLRRRRLRAHGGREIEARAGREVILCAGAVGTPQMLELSGIGKPEILKAVRHPRAARLAGGGREFPRPPQCPHRLAGEGRGVSPTTTRRAGCGAVDAGAAIPHDPRRLLQPALGAAAGLPQDAARAGNARRPDAPRALRHQGPEAAQAAGFPVHDGSPAISCAPKASAPSTSARPIPTPNRRSASISSPTPSTSAPWSTASA